MQVIHNVAETKNDLYNELNHMHNRKLKQYQYRPVSASKE